jgi:hypothetical protein
MSLENKLRKPTQGQMPAAVVDELAVQPPQEPENVADVHREQIINNEEELIPIALRILSIFFLVMNFL